MVKRGVVEPFIHGVTLDIAPYESLSAIWKECRILKRLDEDTAMELLNVVSGVLAVMEMLTIRGVEREVFETASKEGLTVYDASYLHLAAKNDYTLVTDDRRLKERASKYVEVLNSKDLPLRRFSST
ncbi:MAG: type II toxin-antitoxin system VapC family toxin [Candidatus Bathyarchaeia archaeon]